MDTELQQWWIDLADKHPLIHQKVDGRVVAYKVKRSGSGDGASIAQIVHALTASLSGKVIYLCDQTYMRDYFNFTSSIMLANGLIGFLPNINLVAVESMNSAIGMAAHRQSEMRGYTIIIDCDLKLRPPVRYVRSVMRDDFGDVHMIGVNHN